MTVLTADIFTDTCFVDKLMLNHKIMNDLKYVYVIYTECEAVLHRTFPKKNKQTHELNFETSNEGKIAGSHRNSQVSLNKEYLESCVR